MSLRRRLFPGLYKTANRLEAENRKLREQRDSARMQRDNARESNRSLRAHLANVEDSRYELWRQQYSSAYNLKLPPEEFQKHIGGTGRAVIMGGFTISERLAELLEKYADRTLNSFQTILDFGCGCGRVTRFLKPAAPDSDLHACDIDRPVIEWCTDNLSEVARFAVNNPEPPAPYPDQFFDFHPSTRAAAIGVARRSEADA